MSKALDKIKQEILERRAMEQLLDPDVQRERDQMIAQGLRDIPVSKIVAAMQYLENELIPRVKKKAGNVNTPDLKFFYETLDSLVWAMIMYDRYDNLAIRYNDDKLTIQLLRDRCALLEKEILKYQSLEELFLTDGLDRYVENVKKRVAALKKKPL